MNYKHNFDYRNVSITRKFQKVQRKMWVSFQKEAGSAGETCAPRRTRVRLVVHLVQNLFLNADIFPGVLGAECFQQGRYPGDDLRPGFLYRIYPVFRQPDKNLPVVA